MKENLLIVEYSSIDRKMIKKILENNLKNIRVYEMEFCEQIINSLIKYDIKACILSVINLDGISVLKEIKNSPYTKDIPIIIMTGSDNFEIVEKSLRLGALDYFTKPLTEEAMKLSLPLKVKNAIELTNRNQTINYISYHDSLTDLYNRRFFEEELMRLSYAKQYPISIISGDMNGLKLINDFLGHKYGDSALKSIADILRKSCRNKDIISRWGGDEFFILLPKTSSEKADEICAIIRERCQKEDSLGFKLSISLGHSTIKSVHKDTSELIIDADKKMYQEKLLIGKQYRATITNHFINL